MSRKNLAIILGIIVVLIVAIIVIVQNQDTSTPIPAASTATGNYTMTQVATHNNATSCWTAINGSVYDVTAWISQHPGGQQAIISLCGTDGSAGFNGQHGGKARPAAELAAFKIGTLN